MRRPGTGFSAILPLSIVAAVLFLSQFGCTGDPPEGVAVTPAGNGPMVVYDPFREPEPEVPFPSNLATRFTSTTRTGRILNLSEESPLALERRLRSQYNELDGFSVFGAITVSFDAPIDLKSVHGDSVLLLDASPDSPDFGKKMPLDLGAGMYPANFNPREMHPYEEHADLPDLIFGAENTVDGVRVEHYEVETHTLLIRPVFALRPQTTYAVVITREVTGLDGEPVRSPFYGVNHPTHTSTISEVTDQIPGGAEHIAFAWVFTTQSVADDLVDLRKGLDGEGAFGWLRDLYPGRFLSISDMGTDRDGDGTYADEGAEEDPQDHRFILQPDFLALVLKPAAILDEGLGNLEFAAVDHFVFGWIESPDLRDPEDGAFRVDYQRGITPHSPEAVPFILSVPRATEKYKPPFPVIIYSHGATTSRLEQLAMVGDMAARGFAMAGIDAVGHGPIGGKVEDLITQSIGDIPEFLLMSFITHLGKYLLDPDYEATGKSLEEGLVDLEASGAWRAVLVDGRAEDLDGDGLTLSGDGYFRPNPFQLNANTRQTLIDTMMLLRILQRFDPERIPEKIDHPRDATDEALMEHLMEGDFNADGVLDVGGPGNSYYAMGTSLGGIHTSVLMAVEPALQTGVPIVSGGGMTDLVLRSSLSQAIDPVLAQTIGPAVVGCPRRDENDEVTEIALVWHSHAYDRCKNDAMVERLTIGTLPPKPGGTVEIYNPLLHKRGGSHHLEDAQRSAQIAPDGGFSVNIAADKGDPLMLTLLDADGLEVRNMTLQAPMDGLGRHRNSPRLRRALQLAQIAMDRADPATYARHLIREPLEGMTPRNVLHLADIGDRTVPFASMLSWDRAAGLLSANEDGEINDDLALDVMDEFIRNGGLLGQAPYWDIEDLQGVREDARGPLPVVRTTSGVSAVRFPATDKHEYIALPKPDDPFNWATYSRNQLLHFLESDGQEIPDGLCLETSSCGEDE